MKKAKLDMESAIDAAIVNEKSGRGKTHFENLEIGSISNNGKYKIFGKIGSYSELQKELSNKDCDVVYYCGRIYAKGFCSKFPMKTKIRNIENIYSVRDIDFIAPVGNRFNFFNFLKFFNFFGKGKNPNIGKEFWFANEYGCYGTYVGIDEKGYHLFKPNGNTGYYYTNGNGLVSFSGRFDFKPKN